MNKAILMGRLARDPQVNTTQSGVSVAKFTLAVDRKIPKDKIKPGQQTADFIGCTAFRSTADFVGKYLTKGSQILIEGRITTGSYDKDGAKVYTTDVTVERVEFAGNKAQNATANATADAPAASASAPVTPPQMAEPPTEAVSEEDIPF